MLIEVGVKVERLFRRLLGRDNAHIRQVCSACRSVAPTKIAAIIAIYRVLIEMGVKVEGLFRRLLGRDNAHIRQVCSACRSVVPTKITAIIAIYRVLIEVVAKMDGSFVGYSVAMIRVAKGY